MSLKQTLMSESSTNTLWGGPLWRRIVIAVVGFVALGAWILMAGHLLD